MDYTEQRHLVIRSLHERGFTEAEAERAADTITPADWNDLLAAAHRRPPWDDRTRQRATRPT